MSTSVVTPRLAQRRLQPVDVLARPVRDRQEDRCRWHLDPKPAETHHRDPGAGAGAWGDPGTGAGAAKRVRVQQLEGETAKLVTEREILRRAAKYFAGETNW